MKKVNLNLKIDKDQLKKKLDIRDGEPGEKGKDADEEKIVKDVLSQLPEPALDTGELIVDKINELPTDDDDLKIDASHIKNLPKSRQGGGFSRALIVQDEGSDIAQNPKAINFTGASVAVTNTNGVATVDISNDSTATWGSITGTLSDQTDLQTALDAKASKNFAVAMAVALG